MDTEKYYQRAPLPLAELPKENNPMSIFFRKKDKLKPFRVYKDNTGKAVCHANSLEEAIEKMINISKTKPGNYHISNIELILKMDIDNFL